ncbi:phage tail length tape measure family protein [Phyllobacterium sp. TAF24]|uniref:phage tail length tape measure family protein n=1 Tax=Phyllobacterium sp. TAF24 TaxID=3233068 RepID=UPI003F981CFA
MTIASLGLAVDSGPAVRATVDLDKLAASSAVAEQAVNKLGTTAPAALSKVAIGTGPITQKLRETASEAESFSARVLKALNFRSGIGNASEFGAFSKQLDNANSSLGRVGNSSKLTANQLLNLSRQGNDVITMFALGAPAMQIFASQAGQIYSALEEGPGGLRGSLKALGEGIVGLATRFPLVTAAIAAAGVAAGTYALLAPKSLMTVDEALEKHQELIQKIADRWPGATEGLKRYTEESTSLLAANAREQTGVLEKAAKDAARAFSSEVLLSSAITGGASYDGVATRFKPFEDAIKRLRTEVAAGRPDFQEFYNQVNQIVDTNPAGLTKIGDETIKLAGALEGAEQKAAAARATIGLLGGVAAAQIEQISQFTAAMRELAGISLPKLDDRQLAKYQYEVAVNRASNREDKDSAYQAYQDALARIDEQVRMENTPIPADKPNQESFAIPKDVGAAKAAREIESAKQAYDRLLKSAQDRVEQSKLEADTAGLTGIAQDTLRFKLDLLQKSQAKGRSLTEDQTKALLEQVDAYEKNATAAAKATLQADLMFERQQMFRSPIDQTIASTLKGAGLPVDFDSYEAGLIRTNEKLKEARALAGDFASTFIQGIESGKSVFESLGDAALSVLDKITDKLLNDVLDALFQVGTADSGSGGGILGFLGSLFGGSGSSASSDPWAGMRMADGGAFSGGVQAFAKGGAFSNSIVNSPTLFKFANGTGLMGEAGPEAIMPLKRDSSGRLGVSAGTGAAANSNQSGNMRVTVGVSVDNDGNLQAYVKNVAQSEGQNAAVQVVTERERQREDLYNAGGNPR